MGTIVFVILRFVLKHNTIAFDYAILPLLISLDSIALALLRPKK